MARKHSKHGGYRELPDEAEAAPAEVPDCWLCGRPTGKTLVWHHPVPKSRKGRLVVDVHPICHRTLHAQFTNAELARFGQDVEFLRRNDGVAKFLRWIASKRGVEAADYAASAISGRLGSSQFQGMSSSQREAGHPSAIFAMTSAI